MSEDITCVALIPARGGSKRVPGKNIRSLGGKPLLAYTIDAALASGCFESVMVSTDSPEIAQIAQSCGALVDGLRPAELAADLSPDIDWIRYTLQRLKTRDALPSCFSILRPTSPFRTPQTIVRAWKEFVGLQPADSLRAVEPCSQHPAKMWRVENGVLVPLMENPNSDSPPWHSQAYQALPRVYAQNASLEIAWCDVVFSQGTISGTRILPFFTEGFEGLDINSERDWFYAEHLLESGKVCFPKVGSE